jgi:hypothetical protein
VVDGNGTLSSVRRYDWKALPARVVSREAAGKLVKFDEDQPRDERGRWTSGGGGSLAVGEAGSAALRQWKADQPRWTAEEHVAAGRANQDLLRSAAAEVSRGTDAVFVDPGVKGVRRIEEKLAIGKVPTDVVRGGFKVGSRKQSDEIVAGLARKCWRPRSLPATRCTRGRGRCPPTTRTLGRSWWMRAGGRRPRALKIQKKPN